MDSKAGARNLLVNCANATAGERLLIAYEPTDFGYYDADLVPCIEDVAHDLGLIVETLDVGFNPDNPQLTPALELEFQRADIILFLARLGDQLRFSDMPKGKRIIVSFALDAWLLGTGFGTTHHGAMVKLKKLVGEQFAKAEHIRVTCAKGSDFSGRPELPPEGTGDTTILRFPMSVFQPVPAHTFTGKVALCGFLTGTGSLYYDDYTLEFDGPVFALMENGRVAGFEGSAADVAAANAHYDRVAAQFGIDRNFIHSWHAGIHPGCGYTRNARDNYERWGGASFGNPRLLHFHTCGAYAPGEISWNMLDPTIVLDGVPVWEKGVFHAGRLPGGQAILDMYPCAARVFGEPMRDIGLAV